MLYDPTRQKFVPHTPEEQVRQSLLKYLTETLKIPIILIKTEFALSAIAPKEKGRVDIIVADPSEFDLQKAYLLAECKAKNGSQNTAGKDFLALQSQVNKYLRILHPKHIILALGNDWRFLSISADGRRYESVPAIPVFS
ncbi:hypothetical protein AGMMS49938_10260 [Fibrobacterales bacterium]|nr:hypothetical protein AGMMS49938_10260 [Fibrobacterales bacterium]